MTYNEGNTITLNRAEQYILKNTTTKFIFGLKILDLCLYIIEYRAEVTHSLFGAFKKAETYINVLNPKAYIQKKLDLKSGYEAFKTFQALVSHKQNTQTHLYEPTPYKVYPY